LFRLWAQDVSLLHAEAVLFIYDDEAEFSELHVFVQQGVRADDDARLSARGVEHRMAPPRGGEGPRQERDADLSREGPEEVLDGAGVLGGEHLGRGEQGRLSPASITCSIARSATTVFPDPTSPCNKRCIGRSLARSSRISAATACCPSVSVNGKEASSWSRRPPSTCARGTASKLSAHSRRRARA